MRLGPQESLGTVLVLLGGWATARAAMPGSWLGWDWIYVLSICAATGVKESFALVPPSLLGWRLLIFWRRQGGRAALSRHALGPGLLTLVVGGVVLIGA